MRRIGIAGVIAAHYGIDSSVATSPRLVGHAIEINDAQSLPRFDPTRIGSTVRASGPAIMPAAAGILASVPNNG